MNLLEAYVRELRGIHASGSAVKETSYYPALSNLLNGAGAALKPRVRCVINVKNQGAGIPDGGLFTPDQYASGDEPTPGQVPPARGVIEAKGTDACVGKVAKTEQVSRYLGHYGQVLVTNYRDFLLVERGPDGERVERESFRLAGDEKEFWAADPARTAEERGASFAEFLKRVMLYAAPLAEPRDLAFFLASYAREARARVERGDLPALEGVRGALEEALGLEFEGERGEHFFRSTLVQTLFYGVFAAWVLWSKQHAPASRERFDWRVAAYMLRVPVIRAIFEQIVMPSRVTALGLVEMLDLTGEALNRVDRAQFFDNFEEDGAVQYFYEPFLEAFDPDLRRQLGVWYTPPEIVRYMVERVDAALREDLGLADGLADESVYVLDPCTGTGSYPLEVLKRIGRTLAEKGEDALAAHDLKKAATERVFGFEILPAPFVVAHLQLGLLLQNLGAPLSDDERAGIYLTNALTGWEPPKEPKQHLLFPELEEERDSAEEIKRDKPVIVILGNPPYNGFAGVAVDEERDLSDAYRSTRRAPAPKGQGLNDLYVRFFRVAERRIAEGTGKGVVCYISNYSWLDGLSFTGMRERYLEAFDDIRIDSLNGDKYKTGKLTPDGKPDPSVFSTRFNREGIQVGTAIALLVRREQHAGTNEVAFRNLWGTTKHQELLETAKQNGETLYKHDTPPLELGLPFVPLQAQADYLSWPLLPELFPISYSAVKTGRDDLVVDVDRERLESRMRQYFDTAVSHEEMRRIRPRAMESTAQYAPEPVRNYLRERGFLSQYVVRYCYRPFDMRWLYWEPETGLLARNVPEYFSQVFNSNAFLFTTGRTRKNRIEPALVTNRLCDLNYMDSGARGTPLYLKPTEIGLLQQDEVDAPVPNISSVSLAYVERLGASAQDLFYHVVAVLHSPVYRADNADALRQNWPRVPLPDSQEALLSSAELGRRVAALLDPEEPVPGVTSGSARPELRAVGVVSREGGGALDPGAGDLALRAGWGHRGKNGAVMPGRGRVVKRPYDAEERTAIEEGAALLDLSPEEAFTILGETTCDVYLNDRAYWRNVPEGVWGYTLGGYQVIKKWLSYREEPVLGRSLTGDEAREVRDKARRIASLRLLEPLLDANYAAARKSGLPSGAAG